MDATGYGAIGGGLLGGLKGLLDRGREDDDKRQLALWTSLAPYFAMSGTKINQPGVRNADMLGSVLGGASLGADFGSKNSGILSSLSSLGAAKPAGASPGGPSLGANTNYGPAPTFQEMLKGLSK